MGTRVPHTILHHRDNQREQWDITYTIASTRLGGKLSSSIDENEKTHLVVGPDPLVSRQLPAPEGRQDPDADGGLWKATLTPP